MRDTCEMAVRLKQSTQMTPVINMINDTIDVAIKYAIESFIISALFSSTVAFVLEVNGIIVNS